MDFWEFMLARKKAGGGSGIDYGFCIKWNGDTEGRPFIDLSLMANQYVPSINMYKVADVIISAKQLVGTVITLMASNGQANTHVAQTKEVVSENGWAGVINEFPFIVSGKAGGYVYSGMTITIPEDGTYYLRADYADSTSSIVAQAYNANNAA